MLDYAGKYREVHRLVRLTGRPRKVPRPSIGVRRTRSSRTAEPPAFGKVTPGRPSVPHALFPSSLRERPTWRCARRPCAAGACSIEQQSSSSLARKRVVGPRPRVEPIASHRAGAHVIRASRGVGCGCSAMSGVGKKLRRAARMRGEPVGGGGGADGLGTEAAGPPGRAPCA